MGPWFHNIHLPDGSQTAPDHFLGDFPSNKWSLIKNSLPENLSGKTVLDIGCNAGFYSLKLAQRGADVTGIDLDPVYLKQAQWVLKQFQTAGSVTLEQKQIYDLSEDNQHFDIILFMGVFYHLRYPLLALDIISRKTGDILVFQTLTIPGNTAYKAAGDYPMHQREQFLDADWPKMAFIENKFNSDPTNWWFANSSCIEALLRSCGMAITEKPGNEIFICTPDPENPGVCETWNESEYLSAIRSDWKQAILKKTGK